MEVGELKVAEAFRGAARLGILEMTGVHVTESAIELKDMLNAVADEAAATYKNAALGEIDTVRKIRSIFHKSGLDPTRYRPSSESLLRRAVKGKGLYLINSVVDLINYFSLKTLWPMGLYDADRLVPPIEWRIGTDGESYEGIGRDRLNLAHFPLLSDANGPFGSPISDSMRTRVTEECTHILWITFAPHGTAVPLQEFAETTKRFCSGEVAVCKQYDV